MERTVINKLKKKKPGLLINFILEMKKTFALDKLRTELYSFEKNRLIEKIIEIIQKIISSFLSFWERVPASKVKSDHLIKSEHWSIKLSLSYFPRGTWKLEHSFRGISFKWRL